eukprot:jgi/Tetstr1/460199/TSEL_005514.t1
MAAEGQRAAAASALPENIEQVSFVELLDIARKLDKDNIDLQAANSEKDNEIWKLKQQLAAVSQQVSAAVAAGPSTPAGSKRYSQVTEGISREAAQALVGDHGTVTHNTTRSHIRSLQPQEICDWLSMPSTIKGVSLKVHAPASSSMRGTGKGKAPAATGDARLHSLELRWTDSILTLKFRTLLLEPPAAPPPPPPTEVTSAEESE